MYFNLPKLPYNYDELEPFFDKKTMEIHHTKHHKAYTDNTNSIISNFSEFSNSSEKEILLKLGEISKEKRMPLQNNLGGYINHNFFWKILKLGTVLKPGKFRLEIEKNFGSLENFKSSFEEIAMKHFGSGWVWLVKKENKLFIQTTINQDNPLMGKSIKDISFGYPILGLDIWEHAYYLKYQNKKLDYVKSFWNVINWKQVESNFESIEI